MIRNQNVSDILYNDALVRNKRRESNDHKRKLSTEYKTERNTNDKVNTFLIVSKLVKEFEKVCINYKIKPNECNIDFAQLVTILSSMEYVSSNLSDDEKGLINLMWSLLKGEEFCGVSSRNIIFFIIGINLLKIEEIIHPANRKNVVLNLSKDVSCLINKIELQSMHDLQLKVTPFDKSINLSQSNICEEIKFDDSNFGAFYDTNKFFFKNYEEQIKLNRLFKLFISRKASSAKCAYFIGKDPSPIDPRYSYRPEINSNSSVLANNIYKNISKLSSMSNIDFHKGHSRVKSAVSPDLKQNHPLTLISKGNEYKNHVREMKEQRREEELKDCTFWPKVNKPTITNSYLKMKNSKESHHKISKSYLAEVNENSLKILKDMANNSQSDNKYVKLKCSESDEIATLNRDEDTSMNRSEKRSQKEIKTEDKIKGTTTHNISVVTNTELDEYLKHKRRPSDTTQNQKGGSSISPKSGEGNETNKINSSNPHEITETPVLFLDVNFGNDKLTRIVMYKDDSPRELAKAFCSEHNLSDSKQEKLVKIIQHHLKGALEKIVEEDTEEA